MTPAVETYLIEQASLRARLLCTTAGFSLDEIEEARQDLLLDCLRRSPKFDSGRGNWSGFVRSVMWNHATVLIARRRRRGRHEVLAADAIDLDSQADGRESFEAATECGTEAKLVRSIAVREIVRRLPHHLQAVTSLIPYARVCEVCEATGKSRSRVHGMLREIREAFIDAGFRPARSRQTKKSVGAVS